MEPVASPVRKRAPATPATLAAGVLRGERLAIARAISTVERGGAPARDLLGLLYPHTGRAHIVGVTGAPGSGKSTLVTALVKSYRHAGHAVGVIAVDPTSPFTGGAILGDRVRMRDLSGDDQVFVRSMATRGSVGGLSQSANDAVAVLDAAGFPRVLVETVGVGQAEIEIAATAHTTLVVEAPGMGDEIQAIKAGILEIADLLVVNKADRPDADRTVQALEMMLDLGNKNPRTAATEHDHHHRLDAQHTRAQSEIETAESAGKESPREKTTPDDWAIGVFKTIAADGTGVDVLLARIEAHLVWLQASGVWRTREEARAAHWLEVALQAEVRRRLQARLSQSRLTAQIERLYRRAVDPYTAAGVLLEDVLTDEKIDGPKD